MGFTAAAEVAAPIIGDAIGVDILGSAAADAAAADLGFASAADAAAAGVDVSTLAGGAADVGGAAAADTGAAVAAYVGGGGAAADIGAAAPSAAGTANIVPPSLATLEQQAGLGLGTAGAGAGGAAGGGLGNILGTASTAGGIVSGLNALSQLGGGAARIAGGVQAQQAGKQIAALAPQAAPFQPYQSQLSAQLFNLLQNPNTVTTTPGYQFNLQQGLQAQQARQAAQGNLVSGGALLQANQFGQQYAQSSLNQQENMLASLTGATQSPASAATAQANLLAGGLGGNLGGAQSIAGGLGNIVSPLSTLYSLYNQASPDRQVA